jgi:ribonuclease G
MQSAFVDIGLERDAFLYVTDFLEEQGEGEAADFERPQGGGGRERQPQREPRSARPPRDAEDGVSLERASEPANGLANGDAPAPARAANGEAVRNGEAGREEFDQGTRRWRGRRGRRRGFRGNPREGASATTGGQLPASSDPGADLDENFHDEPEAPFEAVAGLPISAQAEFSSDNAPSSSSARSSFSTTPEHAREARREGRGDRGRREGRGDSGGESRREPAFASGPPAGAQPILLPGESLSKYGQKPPTIAISIEAIDRSDEKPLPAYTTSRPSTLVEGLDSTLAAWDGVSAALPGESLSKVRNRPRSEPVAAPFENQSVAEAATPLTETFPALLNETQEEAQAELHAAATQYSHDAEVEEAHSAPIEILHAVNTPNGVSFEEVQTHAETPAPFEAFTAQHPAPLIEEVEEEEPAHIEAAPPLSHEWEPEHASASYRVDPVAPSEFRLSSTLEEATVEETKFEEPTTLAPFFEREPETTAHHEVFQAESAPETEPSVAASAEAEEENFYPESNPLELVHAFAPGSGLLEEEVIEEEEYDFTPIHAHADEHDLEEIEEETLDNAMVASQLGDLVRDEHIQRRVSGDPTADDDFDDDDDEEDGAEEELQALSEEESDDEGLAEEELTDPEFADPAFAKSDNGHALRAQSGHGEAGNVPAPRRDDNRRRDGRDRGNRRGGNQRGGRSGHRHSAQTSDLPIISDLLKQGQEVLVQIAKEPIAKKGARITSHIALPGRFLVFMPTVNHVGVSRKISSDEERLRLKRVLTSEKGSAPGGFIVRTAADGASEEELRADLRFLISLWTEIKARSDNGKAPALIYHDLNLVERVLRDQVSDNFSTIWVDSETEYERIVRFLNRFEPSLVRRVKLYTKETPLFEQFGIQEEISKALKSKVWLKSGGSIVINQTEALVAIDINTGKYVGKTARLEDTIVKTNLDAIPEIVRQIRLRDLGGIIIIDFIDMDERKNRNKVMQALEEELKNDRAPSKVLQFNDFGLVAITRKRVKQSLERTLSTQCNICAGTGMVKSPVTVCNEIYTEMRKMQKQFERGDVLLRVNPEIVKTLKNQNGKWLTELEEMIGRTILVKSDPALHPEQFDIH